MTDILSPLGHRSIEAALIVFPNQTITWAGEGIAENTLLFGSAQGYIMESGIDAPLRNIQALRAVQDRESINDAAYVFTASGFILGVSTRTEVCLSCFSSETKKPKTYRFDFGALGIKSTLNNQFVCPAGPTGLVSLFLDAEGEYKFGILPAADDTYFNDVASLGPGSNGEAELFVVACRRGGLVYVDASKMGPPLAFKLLKVSSKPFDFIGVTSVRSSTFPRAIIGLDRDRSIHFIRDYLHSRQIDTLSLPYVPGRAYKLLRHNDHLLLLTSKGLCVIHNIVKQFHEGEEIGGFRKVNFVQIEAIDFNIALDKWLLIVTPEGVIRMDLASLLPLSRTILIPEAIRRRMNAGFPVNWSVDSNLEPMEQPVWQDTSLRADLLQPA